MQQRSGLVHVVQAGSDQDRPGLRHQVAQLSGGVPANRSGTGLRQAHHKRLGHGDAQGRRCGGGDGELEDAGTGAEGGRAGKQDGSRGGA